MMKIHYATISKKGKRQNNEDAFRIVNAIDANCFMAVVCDGMGGHDKGEVASETVADALANYWEEHTNELDNERKVKDACHYAIQALNERASTLERCKMATTMVMASIEADTLTIAHTGDSRCYLMRPNYGLIHQTKDHVRMESGCEIVSRCFFSYWPDVTVPEIVQFKLCGGDRIMLCSDGLYKSMSPKFLQTKMMGDKSLTEILNDYDSLCKSRNEDNYTAVLIEVE